MHKLIKLCLFVSVIVSLYYASATLSQTKKKKSKKEKDNKVKLSKTNVADRGLISEQIKLSDIVENHAKYCETEKTTRNFNTGNVLGYVTPWNSHGYDVAKTFAKFSMVSPVWLQIRRKAKGKYQVTGTHDIDKGWVKDVRKTNPDAQILPRVLFDQWTISDYKSLFNSETEIEAMAAEMVNVLMNNNMDGAVIELWMQKPAQKSNEIIHVMSHMSGAFRDRDLTIVFVIPPPNNLESEAASTSISRKHFEKLVPLVDAFSLMTYDYSVGLGKTGPNAPIEWMEKCVKKLDPEAKYRAKILLGLNFYGYGYTTGGTEPILGSQFVKTLQEFPSKMIWDKESKEHFVAQDLPNNQQAIIAYPTLLSISSRVELAKKLGTGLAIWELGQGLDFFYDLL
ncbi:chitinase domain-containing protein 1 [Ciona intestinalis]